MVTSCYLHGRATVAQWQRLLKQLLLCPSPQSNPYSRLTRVKFKSRVASLSWYGLAECMHLPTIQHISLADLPASLARLTLSDFEGRTCPVRSIEIMWLSEGKSRSLKILLGMSSMLKILEIKMIGKQTMNGGIYTAAEIGDSLVPVRSTLRALAIEGPWSLQSQSKYRLDLSGFKRLESVKLYSHLFFSDDTESPRDGLYTLLPRSLVEFHVRLPFGRNASTF